MGQAKRRGSRDQRIAESLGLKQRSLDDIRKELNLPGDAKFLGYGVHLPEPDEFLASFEESAGMTKKAWAKTPEMALTFDSFSEAYDTSRKCRPAIVVGMFDLGEQIYVAEIATHSEH